MRLIRSVILWAAMSFASTCWALPPGFSLQEVHSGVNFPSSIKFAPDGRLFYTELTTGRIMVFENAFSATATTWATVPVAGGGERGLLDLTFHPAFPDSPYVYVFHSNPSPLVDRIARLRDQGGVGTGYAVLLDNLLSASDIHHGGRLKFGPDGMLYVTVGEQDNPANSENISSKNGKILRLTPMGAAAPGNPFGAGNPAYAMGVRNPFGLCFDPSTGAGYFTDPGPSCDDEVNFLEAGADYGWGPDDVCGSQPVGSHAAIHTFASVVTPVGCCVYRGGAYPGSLQGNLFFVTYNSSTLYRLRFKPATLDMEDSLVVFAVFPTNGLDVTMGPDGCLWVSTLNAISRIRPTVVGVGPRESSAATLSATPNPFRGRLAIDLNGVPSDASLEILDLQGRVARRWHSPLPPMIEWDGNSDSGRPVTAGVYLVRVAGKGFVATRRVVRLTP